MAKERLDGKGEEGVRLTSRSGRRVLIVPALPFERRVAGEATTRGGRDASNVVIALARVNGTSFFDNVDG